MRTASKYKAALALIALLALLIYCGLSGGWLGAVTPITPIPSTDTGPQFITDVNNALAILQQNETTALSVLTPEVLAPTIANLGSVSGTVTCNVAQSSGCQMTLTGPVTSFSLSGGTPGQLITLQINQGASGGATLSWPSVVQWEGPAPVINQTPGATQLYELQTFDGVTWYPLVHSSLTGNAITGTGYLPAITGFNGVVQSALNVMAYGATGSGTSVTATTTSGSASATLNSAGDFQNGQHVVILHAGAATALVQPSGLAVMPMAEGTSANAWLQAEYSGVSCATDSTTATLHNANCTTDYTYQIVNVDVNRGMSAPSAGVTITNGPAALSAQNRVVVTWTPDPNAAETLVYACSGVSCTPSLRAVVPALPNSTFLWNAFNSSCSATSGASNSCYGYMDMGASSGVSENFAQDEVYGTTLPSGAVNQNLNTTIASGAGTVSITLATAPSVSGSFVMWHDDAPAFQSAIHAACGQQITTNVSAPRSRQVYVPSGTYQLGSPLSFFACMGTRFTCSAGGVDIGYANTCYLDWHGAGPVIDLNGAGGTIVESFTIPGGKGPGSTPSIGINIDSNTTNAVLDPGATGTTNAGGYSPANSQSSANSVRNVYIGAAGVGVSIARVTDYLNEKMYFENVEMGTDPTGSFSSEVGGFVGYYFGGWNSLMIRIIGGMVGNRTLGLWWTKVGSLRTESLNFEYNAVDIYGANTIGAGGSFFSELDGYSEGAQHHYYSNLSAFPQDARLEGNSLRGSNQLPNQFFLMPGVGGAFILIGNAITSNTSEPLIAVSATFNIQPAASFDKSVLSMHNVYSTTTPFYPLPVTGLPVTGNLNTMERLNVTSIEDTAYLSTGVYTEVSVSAVTTNNPGFALLGGITGLTVGSLAPPADVQVAPQGTAGSTSYTYWAACQDAFGNLTAGGLSGATTTGNATLSASNWNDVSVIPEAGCVQYYWWKNSTTGLFAKTPGAVLHDTGQAAVDNTTVMPTATQQGVLAAGSVQNGCSGSATLAAGTVTVSNPCVVGSRPILLMPLNDTNHVYVSAMGAGSFTAKSASATDTAGVFWAQN